MYGGKLALVPDTPWVATLVLTVTPVVALLVDDPIERDVPLAPDAPATF